MRRLVSLFLAVFLTACIPIIASGHDDALTSNYQTMSATIPMTTTLDANTGATGPGFTSCSAIYFSTNGAITAKAGDDYCVLVTNFRLRAKGSGHGAGVSLDSASALTENAYVCLNLDATSGNYYDATANPAATAGASGTCTWHPLRC
ncbi:MAG: hypothetical protein WCW66_06620 [Patescibacteria group bacterium]|jgi:hypothetical protein